MPVCLSDPLPYSLYQNLVRVGSAILSPGTRPHWELIQQTEGGTAALLRQFEQYANTLAQNMRKTYLSPFTIVTPHIGEGSLLWYAIVEIWE
jgi:hypothetical protein